MDYTEDQLATITQFTTDLESIVVINYNGLLEWMAGDGDLADYHAVWLHDDPYHYHMIPKKGD